MLGVLVDAVPAVTGYSVVTAGCNGSPVPLHPAFFIGIPLDAP